ncbi:MAG TPA: ABC transporter ATP-binding protein [Candidatus Janibacter merdipullorum]|nr:ABC transporter ATP-binding protein [Candidatus Janibacter merdipullorum]
MPPPTDPIVELTGLRKHYGTVTAVEDVSFAVAEGEIFGILGPNGAGKSTTVECLAGLRTGDAGTARVAGIDPWTDHDAVTRVLGVQLQESQLQDKITIAEALTLWSSFYDSPRPWGELAERLGLSPHLPQRFADLSGGQQQRLSIALALVGRPQVVILDELTTGLDPRARREVWQLIRDLRDEGTTVLLVTHAMEEAEHLCDRIAIIDAGRVRALDTPDGLIAGATQATSTSFDPSHPVDLESLRAIEGVASVHAGGHRVVVDGSEGSALRLLAELASQDVTPLRLRISEGTLASAYLDLTDTTLDKESA